MPFDFAQVNTPAYVVDEGLLRRNLEILDSVQKQTGCRILLALKGFSMHAVFPLVGEYLAGITASALFEARLGREEMGKEVHIYAPAYIEADFPEILRTVDHIVFNSFSEWERYRERVLGCGRTGRGRYPHQPGVFGNLDAAVQPVLCQFTPWRDVAELPPRPARRGSAASISTRSANRIRTALARTVPFIDEKFGPYIRGMKWLNLGGGHHITRPDYDIATLVSVIRHFQ